MQVNYAPQVRGNEIQRLLNPGVATFGWKMFQKSRSYSLKQACELLPQSERLNLLDRETNNCFTSNDNFVRDLGALQTDHYRVPAYWLGLELGSLQFFQPWSAKQNWSMRACLGRNVDEESFRSPFWWLSSDALPWLNGGCDSCRCRDRSGCQRRF